MNLAGLALKLVVLVKYVVDLFMRVVQIVLHLTSPKRHYLAHPLNGRRVGQLVNDDGVSEKLRVTEHQSSGIS